MSVGILSGYAARVAPPPILRRLSGWTAAALAVAAFACAASAQARTLEARIARVTTGVATLRDVRIDLAWPADATGGALRLRAGQVDAPELGYRLRSLDWRCRLVRAGDHWRCRGPVTTREGRATLDVDLGAAITEAELRAGAASLRLQRNAAAPDATRITLTAVPLAWTQAMLAQAWPDGRIGTGRIDGALRIEAPVRGPLRVHGPLRLHDAAFDTPDGRTAGQGLDLDLDVDARIGATTSVALRGGLRAGELLFGSAYVDPAATVAIEVDAQFDGARWRVPHWRWWEPGALDARGSAAFDADGALAALVVDASSPGLARLRDGYLTGLLGLAGLGDLTLDGAADAAVRIEGGRLIEARLALHDATVRDPRDRFGFDALDGEVAIAGGAARDSTLRWRGGRLYGIEFGVATLPFRSDGGVLRLRAPASVPMLGGRVGVDALSIVPPDASRALDIRFGLQLESLDVARLARSLGWPEFGGRLGGRIPQARYAADRLDFDGGLALDVFDGGIRISSLAIERPFGVAPTVSADVALDALDLQLLTGVFDFGSITGRLDGRVDGLRLVDWTPVAFDARLATRRMPGVRQRISQRAVQSISSVGDASVVTSLQNRALALFDDFGYGRIGWSCRLAEDVCTMDGLGSAGAGFIIVEGAGVPRLNVVGFNRRVDWPTLVDRLTAAGSGDVAPVVE